MAKKDNGPVQIGKQDKGQKYKPTAKGQKVKKPKKISIKSGSSRIRPHKISIGSIGRSGRSAKNSKKKKSEEYLALEKEYKKIYNSLSRSYSRQIAKFSDIPQWFEMPSLSEHYYQGKLTRTDLEKIKKKKLEWDYYMGRDLTEEQIKSLGPDVSRAGLRNLRERNNEIRREKRRLKKLQELQDMEDERAKKVEEEEIQKWTDNDDYIPDFYPDEGLNETLGLIQICNDAIQEAIDILMTPGLSSKDRSRAERLKENAELCLGWLTDAGATHGGWADLYFFNLHVAGTYEEVAHDLDDMIYDSDQVTRDEFDTQVLNPMLKEPTKMTASEREQLQVLKEKLGISWT